MVNKHDQTLTDAQKNAALKNIEIEHLTDDKALELIVELKVVLLADVGHNGGISRISRRRAWQMVHELGQILMEQRGMK